ncbi:MAG: DUF938 domain-containing protein [Polyangiales bacterium]
MKKVWPAPERNRDAILGVLQRVLPHEARVVEIASGSGQHAHAFASAVPTWTWQATDLDEENLASIRAWQNEGPANMLPPLRLDVREPWPVTQADAVLCANMIHISPIEASEALMKGAAMLLPAHAPLITYGPYLVDGEHTAESNARFDASLRSRNPAWGLRSVEDLETMARAHGLELEERVAMPANNFMLVLRRCAREC